MQPATVRARALAGAVVFGLLMAGELVPGLTLFGRGLGEQLAATTGRAGLIAQVAFGLMPLARISAARRLP